MKNQGVHFPGDGHVHLPGNGVDNYVVIDNGGARGFFRLGLIEQEEMLLAGASDYGLADPLQQTAISLSHVSLCLLGFKPSLDDLMVMIVLDEYAERIGPVAVDTQRKIEQIALRMRRKR